MSIVLKFMQILRLLIQISKQIKKFQSLSVILHIRMSQLEHPLSFIRAPKQRKSVRTVGHSVDIVHLAKQSEKVGESHKLIMSEVEQ